MFFNVQSTVLQMKHHFATCESISFCIIVEFMLFKIEVELRDISRFPLLQNGQKPVKNHIISY